VLTIEPPFYQLRGVTIFRDHERPDDFYYLPSRATLAKQGDQLSCTLFKYRRDLTDNPALDPTRARGAGLAQFETQVPAANVALLQAELATLSGRPDAKLSPVLFRTCQVNAILARQQQDTFITDLVETRAAPLTVPHHAAFAMALSAEGATLFEEAMNGGQLPVGVAYEMRFLALTPSIHARVSMDYERIYDHFSASVGFTYYVSVKLDLDLTWLVEHDLIKIEITSFTDDADQQRQRDLIMNLIAIRIQKDFFRSAVPPKPEDGLAGPLGQMLNGMLGSSSSGISSASAFFVLKARLEVVRESKTFEMFYDGRTAVELTHVVSGFLHTLAGGEVAGRVLEIDLDDPFFSALQVEVSSAIDFEEMADLTEAVLTISAAGHTESFSFRKDDNVSHHFEVALTNPRRDDYTWDVEFIFDSTNGTGEPRVAAGPFTSRRRVLVVQPLDHLHYQRLGALLGPLDPALVPRLHVNLRLRDDDEQATVAKTTVRLTTEHASELWRVHLPPRKKPLRAFAQTDWEDPSGEVHEGEEVEVTSDRYVALGPYRDVLDVLVQSAVNWTNATTLRVEMRYRDQDQVTSRELTFTKDAAPSARVQFPLRDRTKRAFEWREVLVRADGTTRETEWVSVDKTLLVVGAEPATTGEIRIVWVGDAAGALGLRVDISAARDDGSVEVRSTFLRAGQPDATITVPLTDSQLAYRWEVRRIDAAGETLVRSGESRSNLLVVQAT
jgi:hypothetical protein